MSRYATDEDYAAAASALDEEVTTDDEAMPDEPDEGDEGEVGEEPDEQDEEADDQDSEPAAETISVQVGGETIEVSRDELVKGYMRTADYTRKTQLLAAERANLSDAEAIRQALERNPRQTLEVLARHYGLMDVGDDEYETTQPSPEQVQLANLMQWQEQVLASQREAVVDATLARLHSTYGEFDDEALFSYAVLHKIGDLEAALRAMTYGTNGNGSKRTEKRKVAGQANGASRSGQAMPKRQPEKITSFRDAYEAAKRELEGRT